MEKHHFIKTNDNNNDNYINNNNENNKFDLSLLKIKING